MTGYYSQTLVQGITWSFAVSAVSPGYMPGGGSLPLNPAQPIVENWQLRVDPVVCTAPGYSPGAENTVLSESFDAGELPPNWTIVNNAGNGTWYIKRRVSPCGDFAGNMTGGSGPYALINSDCDGVVSDDASLITPSLDLSSFSAVQLSFDQDYDNLGDTADVDVSTDGGTTWNNALRQTSSARGPNHVALNISSAGGNSNVKVRFHYYNAFFAWWWQVDDVVVSAPTCIAGPGGIVVGNVRDGNTGVGLNGATVTNVGGGSATTFATPNDPNQDDGFYILFAESGQQSFQASDTGYGTSSQNALVVPNSAQRLDFTLGAGELTATPSPLNGRVNPGGTDNQTLTMTNNGSASADFSILEINAPATTSATHGFAPEALRQQAIDRLPKTSNGKPELWATSTKGIPPFAKAPNAGRKPTPGNVTAAYPTDIAYAWGVSTSGSDFWLSNLMGLGGDNHDYDYSSATGALTGATIDLTSATSQWAADGAYDLRSGMMWSVDVATTCVFEVDPVNKVVTGNRVCPNTTSERGIAYDAGTDTFFVGSWVDGTIWHFDMAGNIIDSAS